MVDSLKSAHSQPITVSANLGSSFSHTDYKASSSTARPSTVIAGRDVEVATGRDITIEGGTVLAGQNIILDAQRDLNILAARNSKKEVMTSSSGGAGVGVKGVLGSGGIAVGVNAQANAAGADSEGRGTSYTNALIKAGNTFYGKSGRDTTVAGALIDADRTWMDVGNNLTVASLQDSYQSKSHSWNAGADVTVGYGTHVDLSLGLGHAMSTFDWVGEQTSIIGRKEVDIYVGKDTHLNGSIIATDKNGDLKLNTGTLTYEEIRDKDRSSGWSADTSIAFNTGGGFDKPDPKNFVNPLDFISNDQDEDKGDRPYTPDYLHIGYSSTDKRGILHPTVTEGLIIVRNDPGADLSGLNRELERAREVTRDDKTNMDMYVSKTLIDALLNDTKMLNEHEETAKQYGFLPNLFPGLFINPSITGSEGYKSNDKLDYIYDTHGNPIKVHNFDDIYWISDHNPFLQALYHLVPGVKSFSEIHDRQMQVYNDNHGGEEAPTWYTMVTIPGSFSKSYMGALIGFVDMQGWKSGWEDHIKPSYKLRTGPQETKENE